MSGELLDQELLMSQERPTQLHGQGDVADTSVVVPTEIIARGPRAKLAYENALRFGKVKVYRARIMLIGQDRAGKTSLKKSLLGLPFYPEEQSIVGIEEDPSSFKVDVDKVKNWVRTDEKLGVSQFAKDIARMVARELEEYKPRTDSNTQDEPNEKRSNRTQFDFVQHQESQVKIDRSLPPEKFTEYLIQYLKGSDLESGSASTEPVVEIDLWDFAGQHLYYACHLVFFSQRAVYLLVYDLSKELNKIAEPHVRQGIHDVRLENPNGATNMDNLLSWLVSVSAISPTKGGFLEKEMPYSRPPVLLVGTHADKPFQDIEEMKLQIWEELSGKDYGVHVITQLFSIDNTRSSSDAGVSELRKKVLEVLDLEPYMGEEVPLRWFHFEKVVQALVAQDTFYLNIRDLQTIVQDVCFVNGETEVGVILDFYHDLGMIVKHGSTVVLQAQWLIDLFKQLITIPRYKDMHFKHLHNWKDLEETGLLCMELVRHVFSKFIKKDSVAEKDILDMMERFGLIAEFAMSTREGAKYFVPAQLRSLPKMLCELNPSPSDPCPLYLDFFNGFVPHGIFYQLISRCIRWCSETGCQQPPDLYDHGARLFIGKQLIHQLILLCGKRYIKIVLKHGKPVNETAYLAEAEEVASDVRSFVEITLEDLSRQIPWRGNLEYELRVVCPFCPVEGNTCSSHGMISCTLEDCLCLVTMAPAEQLFCLKCFSDEIPTVPGLEKWFSSRIGVQGDKEKTETSFNRVPTEIIGPRAKLAYENALRFGKVEVYRARIMLIGQDRAGKTSLKKSLLGLPFDPEEQSTVGIEKDPSLFKVDVDQVTNWQRTDNKGGVSQFAKELAKMAAGELEKDETKVDSKPQNKPKEKRSRTVQDLVTEELPRHKAANFSSPKNVKEPEEKNAHAGHHSHGKQQTAPKTPHSKGTSVSHHMGKSDLVGHQESHLEIDPSLPPEEFTKYLIQYLQGLNLQSDSSSTEPVVEIDLWDLAGQQLYYASHPVFLSPRALYLLVCNLSKRLDDIAEPYVRQGLHDVRLENPTGETNLENLLSWLVSVNAISPAKQEKTEKKVPYVRPPVLIVGTHADKPFQDIDEMKLQIQKELSGKDYGRHVITKYFFIDNTQSSSDAGVSELRKEILEVLKKEPYMGKEVPVSWFNFEKVVQALVAKNTFYLNIKDLQTIVQEVCFVKGEDDVGVILDFYHDLGMIVKHGSTVVLQAQWLIDLFKQLITVPRYEDLRESKHLNNWKDLQGKGVLSMDLVRHVFSKFIKEDSVTEKDILDMMERFGLIAKFATSTREGAKYFVPAQLGSLPKDLCETNPSPSDPCPLYLDFLNGFVPHGIFYQLVSRCIRWCSESGCKRLPTLYDHGAKFVIEKRFIHELILLCKKRYIKLVLKHKKTVHEACLAEAKEVASDVRSFLEVTLRDMSRQIPWKGNLRYELRVACPFCPGKEPCYDHGKISSPHEDCLCLIKMAPTERLICENSLCDGSTVLGLEKWFSRIRLEDDRKEKTENYCFDGEDSEEALAKHILQDLKRMQSDAGLVARETNSVLQELGKVARDKGFVVSDNPGSGNCMFHALSEQLEIVKGIKLRHKDVRNTLVQFLQRNPQLPDETHLFSFVDGCQSWDDYLSKMEQDGTWGDHVILCAAANHYETCIRVVSSLPNNNDVIIRPHCPVDESKPLVLGHIREVHYVSLQPIQGNSKKRQFQGESSFCRQGNSAKRLKTDPFLDSAGQENWKGMSPESTADQPPLLINSPPQMSDLSREVVRLEDVQLPVDILLITVEDIEFLSCFFYLKDPVKIYDRDSVGYVYTGHMGEHQEKKLKVALVRSSKGGAVPGGSLATVRNAVPALNPKAVFSVGFCAGLSRTKSKLGDVVVSAKLITSSHRPPAKKDMANLLKHAGDGWQAPLRDPQTRKVKVHCDGEFVSGLKVTEQLVQQYPKAIGAESEGEGVFAAAHDLDVQWAIVKGIAHYAGDSTAGNEQWEGFASAMAASVLANILRNPSIFDEWPHYGG